MRVPALDDLCALRQTQRGACTDAERETLRRCAEVSDVPCMLGLCRLSAIALPLGPNFAAALVVVAADLNDLAVVDTTALLNAVTRGLTDADLCSLLAWEHPIEDPWPHG